jgi:hypothetical protein
MPIGAPIVSADKVVKVHVAECDRGVEVHERAGLVGELDERGDIQEGAGLVVRELEADERRGAVAKRLAQRAEGHAAVEVHLERLDRSETSR